MRENSATNQHTRRPIIDDVPLPPDTNCSDDWEFWDGECRIFHGVTDRTICDADGRKVAEVETTGTQLPDGSIDTKESSPWVTVYVSTDSGLSPSQALRLAAHLIDAALEVHGWTAK